MLATVRKDRAGATPVLLMAIMVWMPGLAWAGQSPEPVLEVPDAAVASPLQESQGQETQETGEGEIVPAEVGSQLEAPAGEDLPAVESAVDNQDADLAQPAALETGQTAETGENPPAPCDELDEEQDKWLDRAQRRLYLSTCGAASWFDGFFGTPRHDASNEETYGRLGMSALWDQRDGWDQKVRFRARYALPAMREKSYFFFGRGDEKELIEESRGPDIDSLPTTFNTQEDDSFLLGLGYGKGGLDRGVRFQVGAVLGFPVNPFVKLSYRRAWALSDKDLLRIRPMTYWRSDEGLGASLNLDVDHLFADHLMLRFGNWGNVSQSDEIQGMSWGSSLVLFQGLSQRRALTYKALIQGETHAEVRVQNYGFELRYRQRVLRKWLFLEFGPSVTWPREFSAEERKVNWGVSVGLEMYFGPVPDAQMR